uniref:Uncharacterized protein n=1 Tax=Haptolina brevifila TaxID=156173 RepID=A0A7S2MU34_9EUKA
MDELSSMTECEAPVHPPPRSAFYMKIEAMQDAQAAKQGLDQPSLQEPSISPPDSSCQTTVSFRRSVVSADLGGPCAPTAGRATASDSLDEISSMTTSTIFDDDEASPSYFLHAGPLLAQHTASFPKHTVSFTPRLSHAELGSVPYSAQPTRRPSSPLNEISSLSEISSQSDAHYQRMPQSTLQASVPMQIMPPRPPQNRRQPAAASTSPSGPDALHVPLHVPPPLATLPTRRIKGRALPVWARFRNRQETIEEEERLPRGSQNRRGSHSWDWRRSTSLREGSRKSSRERPVRWSRSTSSGSSLGLSAAAISSPKEISSG